MTKQEQIEEMAKTACVACSPKACCPLLANARPCEAALEYAKAVYDGGYRKADDVRKETAREILNRIKLYATDSKTDLIDLIDEIANANGVEVEQ